MAHLHLPAGHTDEELAIAGALSTTLKSADLYVTWSTASGAARPTVPATVREPCASRRRRRGLGGLLDALSRKRLP